MNARSFIKSARALIIASGLVATSTILAAAQDVPVALGTQATVPLGNLYVAPPSGVTTLGGHSFDLTAGNLIQLINGQSATFTGSYPNATAVYLLVNTYNTYLYYDQQPVGTVVITFSDGTTQTITLTVGLNVREWRTGAASTINTVGTDTAVPATWTSTQVWSGTATAGMGGGTAVIDMLTIPTPTKTITSIALNDTNTFGALRIDLAGVSVADAVTTPTPTPTPSGSGCTKKNQDDKHKAHVDKHLPKCDKPKGDQETADVEKSDTNDSAEKD